MFDYRGCAIAIVTPLGDDGKIDYPAFRRLLRRQLMAGAQAFIVAGTTGEGVSLRSSELKRLIEAALDEAEQRPIMAGVGGPNTRRTIRLGKLAMQTGAQSLLVVTPSYLKTTQAGLIAHFTEVARQTDAPIMLYNVPSRTGLDMLPETVAELAAVDNIFGIKEAAGGGERATRLRQLCGADFRILSGDDANYLSALQGGADGVISVSANLAPAAMQRIFSAHLAGAIDEAAALDRRLQPLHAWTMREPNPIPVKAALADLGWIQPAVRLPLVLAREETLTVWRDLKQSLADLLIEERQ